MSLFMYASSHRNQKSCQTLLFICIILFLLAFFRILYRNSRFYYYEPASTMGVMQFQERSITIKSGEWYQIRFNYAHFSFSRSHIKYKSDNILIAYVNSSGKILGLFPGTAVITVTVGEEAIKMKVTVK